MKRWSRHLFAASLLAASFMAHGQDGSARTPAAAPTAAQIGTYAQRLLDEQKLATDGPGVVILVARGDQLLYQGARGMASVELGVPMKADQSFRIGSVTKQYAAATLLKLIDQGRAKLDDPLSKYVPGFPNGENITLLQLLNHTSGVKSYTGIPNYMRNPIRRDLSTQALIDEFKNLPVDFKPGERWAYNNSGYVLVGAVIEAITGKAWYLAAQELVLAPNGLTKTVYPGEQRVIPGMVEGYSLDPATGNLATAGLLSMTQPHAAGALVANAQDLWRWNLALHGGKVLSPALYRRMTTPEGPAQASGYGFGITAGTLRGQPRLDHGGGINGFVSSLAYFPQSGLTVVMLRNSDAPGFNVSLAARKLAAFAVGQPYADVVPVTLTEAQLKTFAGNYKLSTDEKSQRELAVQDGGLRWVRQGRAPLVLVPTGPDSLAIDGSVGIAKVERGADGMVVAVVFFPQGGEPGETGERWIR
ncbi:hypothetical protein CDN99_00945 [Roseateles aquatilis]|uniref:Beta-lactamase-related domain-containing protein n=1 Tax=Roseateles aquatilis TaxID=431061 RepID=A0A246JKG7_9BURK|nr:serine hydrolase domain-containing protein [Roseateles aquatilis]OWQ93102.1 hypothetical protein CDN99_00945 [Roseateles aquatilis]